MMPIPGQNGALEGSLAGQTVVMTGLFPELGGGAGLNLGKDKARALIERFGGRVTSAVSGKTTMLLVGKEPGMSKVSKARERPDCLLLDLKGLKTRLEGGNLLMGLKQAPLVIDSYSGGWHGNGLADRLGVSGDTIYQSARAIAGPAGAVGKAKPAKAPKASKPSKEPKLPKEPKPPKEVNPKAAPKPKAAKDSPCLRPAPATGEWKKEEGAEGAETAPVPRARAAKAPAPSESESDSESESEEALPPPRAAKGAPSSRSVRAERTLGVARTLSESESETPAGKRARVQ